MPTGGAARQCGDCGQKESSQVKLSVRRLRTVRKRQFVNCFVYVCLRLFTSIAAQGCLFTFVYFIRVLRNTWVWFWVDGYNQSVRSMISIFARCFIERRVAACENRLFIIFSILAPNSFSFFSTAPQSDRTRWGRLDPGATGHMFDVGSFTFSFTFFTFVYFRLPM